MCGETQRKGVSSERWRAILLRIESLMYLKTDVKRQTFWEKLFSLGIPHVIIINILIQTFTGPAPQIKKWWGTRFQPSGALFATGGFREGPGLITITRDTYLCNNLVTLFWNESWFFQKKLFLSLSILRINLISGGFRLSLSTDWKIIVKFNVLIILFHAFQSVNNIVKPLNLTTLSSPPYCCD